MTATCPLCGYEGPDDVLDLAQHIATAHQPEEGQNPWVEGMMQILAAVDTESLLGLYGALTALLRSRGATWEYLEEGVRGMREMERLDNPTGPVQ